MSHNFQSFIESSYVLILSIAQLLIFLQRKLNLNRKHILKNLFIYLINYSRNYLIKFFFHSLINSNKDFETKRIFSYFPFYKNKNDEKSLLYKFISFFLFCFFNNQNIKANKQTRFIDFSLFFLKLFIIY